MTVIEVLKEHRMIEECFLAIEVPSRASPRKKPTVWVANLQINENWYTGLVNCDAEVSVIPQRGRIAKDFKRLSQPCKKKLALHHETSVRSIYRKIIVQIKPVFAPQCKPENEQFLIIPKMHDLCEFDFILSRAAWNKFRRKLVDEIWPGTSKRHLDGLIFGTREETEREYNGIIQKSSDLNFVGLQCRHQDFKMLTQKYPASMFSPLNDQDKTMRVYPMQIRLDDETPRCLKEKKFTDEGLTILKSLVFDLLEKGVLEYSDSEWNNRANYKPKKDGSYRLVLDCPLLNKATLDLELCEHNKTPKVGEIIDYCTERGFKYFSNLDCRQSTYQVELARWDRHKTAFRTPFGKFQYKRLPFGTKNTSKYFQMKMNNIFEAPGGLSERCSIYVDDILVYGRNKLEHDCNLKWVLDKCRGARIKLNLQKCVIGQIEVEYCGFTAARHFKPIKSKVDAWEQQGMPEDPYELSQFMRSIRIYSMYMNDRRESLDKLQEFASKVRFMDINGKFIEDREFIVNDGNFVQYLEAKFAYTRLINYLKSLVDGSFIHVKDG